MTWAPPASIGNEIQQALQDRVIRQYMWETCQAYLYGTQHFVRSKVTRSVVRAEDASGSKAFTINRLGPLYRHTMSSLSVQYPNINLSPMTNETDDVVKARTSGDAVRSWWYVAEMEDVIAELTEWVVVCGVGALHTYYNKDLTLGNPDNPSEDADEIRVETADGEGPTEKPPIGEVVTVAVSPYNLLTPKGCTRYKDAHWVAVRSYVHRYDLLNAYKDIKKARKWIEEANAETETDKQANHLGLWDVYWRDGHHAIMLGKNALWTDTFDRRIFPVAYVAHTPMPGQMYPPGLIESLIDLQTIYNHKRKQIIDALALITHPKVLCPEECRLPGNAFKGGAGEKVPYRFAGVKPEYMRVGSIPPEAFTDISNVLAEMQDIAGVHPTSMGKSAVNVRSATHAQALYERDLGQLRITQDGIEKGVVQAVKCALVNMKQRYPESRWIRYRDNQGRMVAKRLKNTDIVDYPEVIVEAGSLFRQNAAARRAQIYDHLEMRIIDPPTAAKELGLNTTSKLIDQHTQALSHALDVLQAVTDAVGWQGPEDQIVEFYPTDDFDAFIEVFGEYMQSDEFRAQDPDTQDRVAAHFEIILQTKALAAQWKAQFAAMAQPGMGRPPQPPGPAPDAMVLEGDQVPPQEVPEAGPPGGVI